MTYNLAVLAEPPGLDIFERSDNFNLAQLGIPAPCFSLGMTVWDRELPPEKPPDPVSNVDAKTPAMPRYIISRIFDIGKTQVITEV